ncbi:MAG: hypothetical protein AB7S38_23520 [Vulcanimicrobiota bacterium]
MRPISHFLHRAHRSHRHSSRLSHLLGGFRGLLSRWRGQQQPTHPLSAGQPRFGQSRQPQTRQPLNDFLGGQTEPSRPSGQTREQAFRQNIVKAAEQAGDGWAFTPSPTPQLRDDRGRLVEGNDYWELARQDDHQVLKLRQGADASQAVDDLFENKQRYALDCATAIRALGLKAELDTVGRDDFSNAHQDLSLYGHYDSFDHSFDSGAWDITAGPRIDYGAGPEFGRFDSSNDQLVAGDLRYFEHPGDTTTANQGWNALYLGQDENGQDRFWRTAGGAFTGGLEGHYLSNLRGVPDGDQLAAVDRT